MSSHLYSQKQIIGKYSSLMLYQEHYNYFEFYKNGMFEYHSGASLGDDEFGKGHYFIKNDSLTLNYDLTELNENGHHRYKTYINSNDSVQIKINTFDLDRKILSGISVVGNLKRRYGVLSNKNGVAYLKFKKRKEKGKITISDLCCGNYSFTINSKLNYEVDVFLRKTLNNPKGVKYEIKKYKIIKFSENYIKLKSNTRIVKLNKQLE
jgi:hypothetical protein